MQVFIRLLFITVTLAIVATAAQGQERKVKLAAYTPPPALKLAADTDVLNACANDGKPALVHLDATAAAANATRYTWATNGGKITGEGATATWDLTGQAPGAYQAFVEIETGSDGEKCEAFSSTTVLVDCAPPPRISCPNVSIVCPSQIEIDQPVTFTANLAGGSALVAATYNWTLSAGAIIEGQGTSSITVDTRGLAGQVLVARFSVGGYPEDCSASCSVQIPLPKAGCQKFDEFPDISRNDEKARLDNLAVALQNDPSATAYITVYPAADHTAQGQRRLTRIVEYLVNSRGLNASRLVTVQGPSRTELLVQLSLCPQGATPSKNIP